MFRLLGCHWVWRRLSAGHALHHGARAVRHRAYRHGLRHVVRHVPHTPGWKLVWTCVVASGLAGGGIGWGVGNAMLPPTPVAPDIWAGPDIAGGGIGSDELCCLTRISSGDQPKRVPEPSTLSLLAVAIFAFVALRKP